MLVLYINILFDILIYYYTLKNFIYNIINI